MGRTIAWGMLMERTISDTAALAAFQIASQTGTMGELVELRANAKNDKERRWLQALLKAPGHKDVYELIERLDITAIGHIAIDYMRTDMARNRFCVEFLKNTSDPKDTLIMLDADHRHDPDTVVALIRWDVPVVGALAFRRGEPYFPCAFIRGPDGFFHVPDQWDKGACFRVTAVGTGAIAIQRHVLVAMNEAGAQNRFFRYQYNHEGIDPSEDIYFSAMCEKLGIPMFCDSGLVAPHLTTREITEQTWRDWAAAHPHDNDLMAAARIGQIETFTVSDKPSEVVDLPMMPGAEVVND